MLAYLSYACEVSVITTVYMWVYFYLVHEVF